MLAAGLVAERFAQRRVRAWAYCEREDDLLVRRGVMFTRLSVVPYGRMQFVDVTAGPVERSFGLATVRMHTAAAASDARIPGLSAGRRGPSARSAGGPGRVEGRGLVSGESGSPSTRASGTGSIHSRPSCAAAGP